MVDGTCTSMHSTAADRVQFVPKSVNLYEIPAAAGRVAIIFGPEDRPTHPVRWIGSVPKIILNLAVHIAEYILALSVLLVVP